MLIITPVAANISYRSLALDVGEYSFTVYEERTISATIFTQVYVDSKVCHHLLESVGTAYRK